MQQVSPQSAPARFMAWWYAKSAPPQPPPEASLQKKDLARRGRIASILLLLTIGVSLCILFPSGLFQFAFSHRPFLLIISVALVIICTGMVYLNRLGLTTLVGVVLILGNTVGNCYSILGPGKVLLTNVQLFDTLAISLLFAVALLPPWGVFLTAAGNLLVTAGVLNMFPHEAAVTPHIANVISRAASVEVSIAVIAFLLVQIMRQAIARADRAEEIGKLQKALLKQEHAVADQKRALDASILQIIDTQRLVANGDLDARVPLTQENVLWEVAGSLNNLLNRMRRGIQAEQELAQVLPRLDHAAEVEKFLVNELQEVQHFQQVLEESIARQQPVRYFVRGGRIVGPIMSLLNGKRVVSADYARSNHAQKESNSEPLQERW
ncbi:MAG TPA: hypothetical protein VFU32_11080 [Ktedonobacterales bacterium]|nr:hypothetical protein [Ktedonobacterales bacterium]